MWETTGRAGMISANLMWYVLASVLSTLTAIGYSRPGPPVTLSGASPTYFVPFKVHSFSDDNLLYLSFKFLPGQGSAEGEVGSSRQVD